MLEPNMKELLKGKSMDELLDLIILGLEASDEKNALANIFNEDNQLMEIA